MRPKDFWEMPMCRFSWLTDYKLSSMGHLVDDDLDELYQMLKGKE